MAHKQVEFESFQEGQEFRHIYSVKQEFYNFFVKEFGDHSAIHSDKEFALGQGFPDVIIHGAVYHGLLAHFTGMHALGDLSMTLSVDFKYLAPSFVGDEIEFVGTIRQKSIPSSTLLLEIKVFNRTRHVAVCSGKVLSRILNFKKVGS